MSPKRLSVFFLESASIAYTRTRHLLSYVTERLCLFCRYACPQRPCGCCDRAISERMVCKKARFPWLTPRSLYITLKCSARWNNLLGFVSFFNTPRMTSSKVSVACFLFSTVRFTAQKSRTFFRLEIL